MPPDHALPLSRLPARHSTDQIARHFAAAHGVRVDLRALEALPAHVRLSLAGARPPEPSEAALLDQFGAPPGTPTESGVQHYFVALLLAALLGRGTPFRSVAYARSTLDEIGLTMR